MKLGVADIVGLSGLPTTPQGVRKWLSSHEVATSYFSHSIRFSLTDLPEEVRIAYLHRELDQMSVEPGEFDDAAHEAYMQASTKRRDRAERKAAIARALVKLRAQGMKQDECFRLARVKFGQDGTSAPSLKRLLHEIKGVQPINFAPVLLDGYKAPNKRAEFHEDAWRFFLTMIRDAAPEWPLKEAWRRTRDAGKTHGWAVPSYPTFYRRWKALSEAQRRAARFGRAATVDQLTQPVLRDKTSIAPLEWVSLDGRMLDFWVDWGDGKPVRPIMLALVDVASNKVLDWELAPSENATATVRLVKRVCQKYGIFDRLYTDNGSAFAGHMVAGGNAHRFRNGPAKDGAKPIGICKIMGIDLHFALPRNRTVVA